MDQIVYKLKSKLLEGVNGRLPNQDLINSFQHIARRTGVPVVLYDHKDEPEQLSWLPEAIRNHHEIKTYAAQARNLWRNVGYQASGRGSGVHGLFHKLVVCAHSLFLSTYLGCLGTESMLLQCSPYQPLDHTVSTRSVGELGGVMIVSH